MGVKLLFSCCMSEITLTADGRLLKYWLDTSSTSQILLPLSSVFPAWRQPLNFIINIFVWGLLAKFLAPSGTYRIIHVSGSFSRLLERLYVLYGFSFCSFTIFYLVNVQMNERYNLLKGWILLSSLYSNTHLYFPTTSFLYRIVPQLYLIHLGHVTAFSFNLTSAFELENSIICSSRTIKNLVLKIPRHIMIL